MQSVLNLKIKYREIFRPFAPAVLREDVAEYFEMDGDSPYMLLVADVAESRRRKLTAAEEALFGIAKLNVPRSDIPAVTHVDYSARVQTVHADTNPRFHRLLREFQGTHRRRVLVNTSFNVRDEPIVCTPEDAYRLLHGDGDGRAGDRQFHSAQIGAASARRCDSRRRESAVSCRLLACLKPPGGEGSRWNGSRRFPLSGNRRHLS